MKNKHTKKMPNNSQFRKGQVDGSAMESANRLNAIFYFLCKNYEGTPSLYTFLVSQSRVIFTDEVDGIVLEKKPQIGQLQILTPPVPKECEEARTVSLLVQFGRLILELQKEGILLVEEMLNRTLSQSAKDKILQEYLDFCASRRAN